ncbi:hypothetical protein GCM10009647_075990 [Streptomyces sanglieri]|uniref:CopG family transcriptional regulator n=1 Tax=Streptomyces sanglieri TaxID=193460 RepID=A0ABW2WK85_9ACTN
MAPQCGRNQPVGSGHAAIELTDELIELERSAWAEQQENWLTVETAQAVQAAITAHAEATRQSRYDVERELRRIVRHPAEDDG